MKARLTILFTFLFLVCICQTNRKEQKTYTVEGTLTQSSQYCGGMQPSHEEEAELHRPKPYYSKLYVRKGKTNSVKKPIIDSTTTDNEGHYKFNLPPGDYVIIMPYQKDKKILKTIHKLKSQYIKVNKLCLIGWWKGGLYSITVKNEAIKNLDHNFHHTCFIPYPFPCISYFGPHPP